MEFTKESLIREIKSNEGMVISEGTLKLEDLLCTYYQLIKDYNLSEDMAEKISSFFDEEPTCRNYFYNNTHLFPEKEDEACYYLNEDVFDFFNDITPEGYYFGTTEGDGACFGFFKNEENF